jgi:hypothetical protein
MILRKNSIKMLSGVKSSLIVGLSFFLFLSPLLPLPFSLPFPSLLEPPCKPVN